MGGVLPQEGRLNAVHYQQKHLLYRKHRACILILQVWPRCPCFLHRLSVPFSIQAQFIVLSFSFNFYIRLWYSTSFGLNYNQSLCLSVSCRPFKGQDFFV